MRRPIPLAFALFLSLWSIPAGATEDLVFYPATSPTEIAFVHEDLGRGEPPVRDPVLPGSGWDFAVVDLDNDRVSEVAVRPSAACEGEGCGIAVFTRINDRWVQILATSERELSVARSMHRGHRDLVSDTSAWRWAGKAYARVN